MSIAASELQTLIESFMSDEFQENPLVASRLGVPGYDHEMGDFSAAGFESQQRRAVKAHEAFAAVTTDGLDLDEAVDRDLAVAMVRGRVLTADWQLWRRDPMTYLAPIFSGTFVLVLRRLLPEAELARALAARLRAAPRLLAAARENLEPELVSPLFVEMALDQVRAGPRFARENLPAEFTDEALRAQVADAGEVAARALEEFERWLTELAPNARGDWALGEPLYSALLRERELLDHGAAELMARGRAVYAELDQEMAEVAARVPGGSGDWRAVMESLNDDHPPTPEAMRQEYAEATDRARAFLVDHDLVSFADGEHCRVEPAPVFQRGVLAVASYMGPPGLTDDRVGHFFVPTPPDGATPEQITQRLRTNSRASMPSITTHEAYPGHHWHRSWAAGRPRRLREVLGTPYFTEGWGLYAERVMHEHGFFTSAAQELGHLNARIIRAARIVVDTSLHTGEMSFDEAVTFMVDNAALSPGTARLEVRRYCAWPTQAAAYMTGCLEIERIRDDWRAAHPEAPLRDFHDLMAGSGSLPLGLAARVAREG